nr:YjcZ family sporulation protein [Salipaludibacillus neizhouensis]
MIRFNKMYGKLKQGGMNMSHSYQSGFALLVVLFILLVIIGASWAY